MNLRWLRPIVFALLGSPLGWWARGESAPAHEPCAESAWVLSAFSALDAQLVLESAVTELDCTQPPCRWVATGVLEHQDLAELVTGLERVGAAQGLGPGAVTCGQEGAGFECVVVLGE